MTMPITPPPPATCEAGRMRALAVTTPQRDPDLPDVPTMSELGYKTLEMTNWYGIFAPSGTPKDVVARLQKEIAAAIAQPKVAQTYINAQVEPASSTPGELAALVAAETAKYVKVVKAAGIKAQ